MFGISDAGLFLGSKKENKAKQVLKLGRFLGSDTYIKVNGSSYSGNNITLYPLKNWSGSGYQQYGDINREILITGEGFVSTIMTPVFTNPSTVELSVEVDGDIYTEIFDIDTNGRIVLSDTMDNIPIYPPYGNGKFRQLNSDYSLNIPCPVQNVEKIFYEEYIKVSYNLISGSVNTSSNAYRHFIVVGIKK